MLKKDFAKLLRRNGVNKVILQDEVFYMNFKSIDNDVETQPIENNLLGGGVEFDGVEFYPEKGGE